MLERQSLSMRLGLHDAPGGPLLFTLQMTQGTSSNAVYDLSERSWMNSKPVRRERKRAMGDTFKVTEQYVMWDLQPVGDCCG
jgi:hypothetical protein